VFEDWDTSEPATKPPCPECSTPDATRLISKLRLDYVGMGANGRATSDAFTTGIDKWAKRRRDKLKIENRNLERHGTVD